MAKWMRRTAVVLSTVTVAAFNVGGAGLDAWNLWSTVAESSVAQDSSSSRELVPAPEGMSPIYRGDSGTRVTAAVCDLRLSVSKDFPRESLHILRAAAEQFNGPTPFTVTVKRGAGDIPVVVEPLRNGAIGMAEKDLNAAGQTMIPRRLVIDPQTVKREASVQLGVYLHEIGHMFGLTHSDISGTVMYPSVSGATELTAYEVRALRKTGKNCG